MTAFVIGRSTAAIVMILVGLVGASAIAFIVLPKATITVTSAVTERTVTRELTLSKNTNEPDYVRFVLPARVVQATVTEQREVKREGGTVSPGFATGTVTVHNEQAEEQPLLPKTHLRHEASGVYFLTDRALRLPPQSTLDVTVTAKAEGAGGNVPPGRFIVDKLPASLQSAVFGVSAAATSGGEMFETALTDAEIDRARAEAKDVAAKRLAGELTAAAGSTIRDGLTSYTRDEVSASASTGSRMTSFTVTANLSGRAFVTDDTDLLGLTVLALKVSAATDEDFISYDPTSFSVELIRADFERGEARIRATLTGQFNKKVESSLFDTTNLAGRSAAEVEEYFKQFPSVGATHIAFSPFWVRTVPGRAGAVAITVVPASQ